MGVGEEVSMATSRTQNRRTSKVWKGRGITSQEKIETGDLKEPEIAHNVAHMHPTHGCILDQVFVFNCTHAVLYAISIMLLYIIAVRHKPQVTKAAYYHEMGEINTVKVKVDIMA